MKSEINKSGLEPRGLAVLVKPYEEKKADSLIVMPDTVRENARLLENRAIVIELGGEVGSLEPARAQPGEKVFISKFAGFIALGVDGEYYRFVNNNDIFAAITEG